MLTAALLMLGASAASSDTAFVEGLSPAEAFEATVRLLNEERRYALDPDSTALQIEATDFWTHGPVSGTFRFVEAAGGTSVVVTYDPDFEYGHFGQRARSHWPRVLAHVQSGLEDMVSGEQPRPH